MDKKFYQDAFGWGFILWLIGYVLGILLFPIVPPYMLGWVIMPIGIVITLWVLLKKVKIGHFGRYLSLALVWTLIAVICDYLFLVLIFKPVDGYYKLDVYLYYLLAFIIPLVVGLAKGQVKSKSIN